jgi:hypothetical protein
MISYEDVMAIRFGILVLPLELAAVDCLGMGVCYTRSNVWNARTDRPDTQSLTAQRDEHQT